MQNELLELADLFIENEQAICNYYKVCLEKFPEYKESWEILINQETNHSEIFQKIKQSIQDTPYSWIKGKFHEQTLRLMTDDIKKKTSQFANNEINKRYALTFIMDVENSLIEGEIIKAFQTDLKDMLVLLNKVQSETQNHRKLLQTILAKSKV